MNLSRIIGPNHISIGWPGKSSAPPSTPLSKWQLIEKMTAMALDSHNFTPDQISLATQLVIEREKSMTTGIGERIAVPHASVSFLTQPAGSLVILPEGMDFDSMDKQAVNVVILLLVPKEQFQEHIQTLASIARLTHKCNICQHLVGQSSAEQAWQVLTQLEKKAEE